MFRDTAISIGLAGLLSAPAAFGQQAPAELQPVPEPPELPERVRSGEVLEPDVTIIRGEERTVTEYRVNGELRAIKVEHEGFPAYYLLDTDGDGRLDVRRQRLDPDFLAPHWVLFSW